MALLSMNDVSLGFGGTLLLENINLSIEKGERVCLLGRNGEGKTTLLKLLKGDILADEGNVNIQKGVHIASLSQEVPKELGVNTYNVVAGGLGETGQLLDEYQRLSKQLEKNKNIGLLQDMDRIQHKLEVEGGWQIYQQVDAVISRLNLDPEALFESLSAGLKRRVLLARALVGNPDVLLLDEPTNHLDVNTISWMEDFLLKNKGSLLFVTHDRLFLQRLATRIIEIDRGSLTSWDCDYKTYLKRKQETLDAESEYRFQFKKKLAQEEVWLRKGVKARRTRNEGRVQALLKMREEKRDWRRRVGTARMQVYEAERTGKLVVEAKKITYSYDGKKYSDDFSATIIRGDRIGIIGPNGSGKSTLLGLLLGEKPLQEGLIRLGTRLETAYFDQLREQLNEEMTVQDNVADGKEMLSINGKPRHVIGYLKDFLL
mgnify:FL=1